MNSIFLFKPGVKDCVVADPILAVHDEHRVGREPGSHLVTNDLLTELPTMIQLLSQISRHLPS